MTPGDSFRSFDLNRWRRQPEKQIDWREVAARFRSRPQQAEDFNPFRAARPFPGVLPRNKKPPKLAMDDLSTFTGFANQSAWLTSYQLLQQGYSFLGYPALAEFAQVPEFRVISEVIATEMTRKWIEFKVVGDEGGKAKRDAQGRRVVKNAKKAEKIRRMEDIAKQLSVRSCFAKLAVTDGWFGRAHLYYDTGDTERPDELRQSIGDGESDIGKVNTKKPLKALRVVEPVWTYPAFYNSNDPLRDDWYNPETWYVMGKELHRTRLPRFVMREVPDLLKPAYSFGGLAMSQMALPYVNNWLRTRQSVSDIVHAFSVMVFATQQIQYLQQDSDQLDGRIQLFNNTRDNKGLLVIDKATEDFSNVSAPLGTLDALQAQSQEQLSSVSRIPLVKLLGITPQGLNASSEGEIRVFEDTIHSCQEYFFRPGLKTTFNFIQLSEWGAVDPDIDFDFVPLHTLDELQLATKRKTEAETHQVYVDQGTIGQEEVRAALADDPDTPYNGLDPEKLPVNPAAEMPESVEGEPVGARHIIGQQEEPDAA